MHTFVLILKCKDRKGIVARVSEFIFACGGNIIALDQHATSLKGGELFMRVEFMTEKNAVDKGLLEERLKKAVSPFKADFKLFDKGRILRMGILVSRPDHCLAEILYLWKRGELVADIPFIISNFSGHKELVRGYKIPFYFIPAAKTSRKEKEILRLIQPSTDFLCLARYMLVLSPGFINSYAKDIINIHHGFLPSFKGAKPYQQALDSGVKVIGATSHFVTDKLDAGPIISQAVAEVSHRDNLGSLLLKGRDLERRALSSALSAYTEHRIIRLKGKTVVF
jgi:formyltetrahydrofolate deformylase